MAITDHFTLSSVHIEGPDFDAMEIPVGTFKMVLNAEFEGAPSDLRWFVQLDEAGDKMILQSRKLEIENANLGDTAPGVPSSAAPYFIVGLDSVEVCNFTAMFFVRS